MDYGCCAHFICQPIQPIENQSDTNSSQSKERYEASNNPFFPGGHD